MRLDQPVQAASAGLAVVERASAVFASIIVFAMMCLVFVDVLGRKLFNAPVQGAVEVAELALPAVVYLGIAFVQARGEHVKLELFSSRLPASANRVLALFGTALGLVMCTLITVLIGGYAWESWSISDHTMGIVHIPIWPAKAAAFFGFLLLSLRLAIQLVEMAAGGRGEPDAAAASRG